MWNDPTGISDGAARVTQRKALAESTGTAGPEGAAGTAVKVTVRFHWIKVQR
jgi:hypothetical protein